MMKRILLDVDECCLSWVEGFKKFAEKKLGRALPGMPQQFDVHHWLEIPKEEALDMVWFFNDNDPGFGLLDPMHKAEIYLPKLKSKGFDLIAISACSQLPATIERRKENLINHFGDIFSHIHCVAGSANKTEYLQKYPPCFWVEDRPDNARKGLEVGHRSFVIRNTHNMHQEKANLDMTWVDSWEDIYRTVLAINPSVKAA